MASNHKENAKKRQLEFHKVMQRYIPIVIVNVLIIIVLGYFASPFSKVGSVTVEGNTFVYDQEIINTSGIRSGDSVIETMRFKDKVIANVVDELPQVSSSTVELSGFNDIIIDVKEYNTVAYI